MDYVSIISSKRVRKLPEPWRYGALHFLSRVPWWLTTTTFLTPLHLRAVLSQKRRVQKDEPIPTLPLLKLPFALGSHVAQRVGPPKRRRLIGREKRKLPVFLSCSVSLCLSFYLLPFRRRSLYPIFSVAHISILFPSFSHSELTLFSSPFLSFWILSLYPYLSFFFLCI